MFQDQLLLLSEIVLSVLFAYVHISIHTHVSKVYPVIGLTCTGTGCVHVRIKLLYVLYLVSTCNRRRLCVHACFRVRLFEATGWRV